MRPSELLERLPGTGVRILGVDGFSGSGKTTLADALARVDGVSVVSIEAFYPGWDGLAAGVDRALAQLVLPLRAGRVPTVRPWDWEHGTEGPPTPWPVGPTVVLEGCGAGAVALRRHQDLTVWVHAEPAERERRLRARADWALYRPFRAGFERQEQDLARRDRTAEHADLVVAVDPDGGIRVLGGEDDAPGWVRSAP